MQSAALQRRAVMLVALQLRAATLAALQPLLAALQPRAATHVALKHVTADQTSPAPLAVLRLQAVVVAILVAALVVGVQDVA